MRNNPLSLIAVSLFMAAALPPAQAQAQAQVRSSVIITGEHGNSEGVCSQVSKDVGGFDCTYGATNNLGTAGGWSGPSLGGTYFAAGSVGDSTSYAPVPGDAKINPTISGSLIITNVGEEALISGTIILGPGVRNIATGPLSRTVQRWTSITHTLANAPVTTAAANSNGGFDYVIGSLGAPEDICLAGNGACFGDHEAGASPATGPADAWGVGGVAGVRPLVGITALESLAGISATGDIDRRNVGATTTAVIAGDSCTSTDINDCTNGTTLWGRGENPGFDNLILVFATNSAGDITSGRAYWSQDFRQESAGSPSGDNSSIMGSFDFTGTYAPPDCGNPIANVLVNSSDNSLTVGDFCTNFEGDVTIGIVEGPYSGTAVVDGNNRIVYTPNADFIGTDFITYNGSAGTDNDDGVLTINVVVDVDPVAPNGGIPISTRGVAPATVSGTVDLATLPGYADGNPPTSIILTAPANGTALLDGTSVTYTPSAGFYAGTDEFAYTLTDSDGGQAQGALTVTIEDLIPAIANAVLTTDQNVASGPEALVVTPGNGSPAQHTLDVTTDGTNGTCSLTADDATGEVIYTPDAGFFGTDSCVLGITDGDGDQSTATVSITVDESAVGDTPPTITSSAPPGATVGNPYAYSYRATGTAPITFSVTAGELPPGLVLSAAGVISGTPTTAGTYTGSVTAANGTLPNATQAFSIVVARRTGSGGGGGGAFDGLSVLGLLVLGLVRRRHTV